MVNFFRLSLIAVLCGMAVFLAEPAAAREYDRYRIEARLKPAEKALSARQTVSFTNRTGEDLTEVWFHIYPNRKYTSRERYLLYRYAGYFKVDPFPDGYQRGRLFVTRAHISGQELNYSVEGMHETLLRVALPQGLAPGQSISLELEFDVHFPHTYGRFGWHKSVIKAAYWYPILCAQTESGWAKTPSYPFHRPFFSDSAYYDVRLTMPAEQVLIHSGYLKERKVNGDKAVWKLSTDHPIRAHTFAASPDYALIEGRHQNTDLRVYYLPGGEQRARQALKNVRSALTYYTHTLDEPYPYRQFSVAPVHLGYGGEQMPNLIFIDTRVFKMPGLLNRHFDYLLAHETGHQWFYNLVGVNTYRQMWLEEGLESYLVLEYIEKKYGADASLIDYPQWFEPYSWIFPEATFRRLRDYRFKSGWDAGHDGPLVAPLDAYPEPSLIFALIYGKGERVMETIEERIGKDNLYQVFRLAMDRYRFQNWSVADFRVLSEEAAGEDLEDFFHNWLYTEQDLDYAAGLQNGRTVVLKNHGRLSVPVNVRVDFSDGSREEFIWQGQEKTISYDRAVGHVVIDPDARVLDRERLNNHAPRQWNWQPVPYYWGLYDLPLFVPEDAYSVVFGPEIREGVGAKISWQKPYDQILYGGVNYEFSEEILNSRVGYMLKNQWHSATDVGVEVHNRDSWDDDREDLLSTKFYVRRNLWPVDYGLWDIQDHVTAYLIRNQRLNEYDEGLPGAEDVRNIEYERDQETIFGVTYHRNRSGSYPDPEIGYRLNLMAEHAAHVLGGQSYFYRTAADYTQYVPLPVRSRIAFRTKLGAGYPDDKDLFQLGGPDGLRGYDRKSQRGSQVVFGAAEWRIPLVEGLNAYAVDRIFGLRRIDGALFAEAGRVWFESWEGSEWKKDVGAGLRFHVDLLGFLEKAVVQIDAAKAIDDSSEDVRFWFSINSAF
ncbi:MAG: M1 family aminopeptidase [Candidatus Omnitrophota bacterium]